MNNNYVTTFSVKNWQSDQGQEETFADLKKSFSNAPIAVKVWKNIDMDLKDDIGEFSMMDHPTFDPILDFPEDNIIVSGHNLVLSIN